MLWLVDEMGTSATFKIIKSAVSYIYSTFYNLKINLKYSIFTAIAVFSRVSDSFKIIKSAVSYIYSTFYNLKIFLRSRKSPYMGE
jgi:hypothetical protein